MTGKKKDTVVKKKIQSSVCWVRGSGNYDRKKKDTVICLAGCAVVLCQFLILAGNWQFFCCGGKFSLRPEKKRYITTGKKRYSRLSDGCAVLAITTGKKRYSRLSGGLCCCVSFWFWRVIGSFFVVAGKLI